LIVTNRGDYTADWLILELESRGAQFVRFNTEDFPSYAGVTWGSSGDRVLQLGAATHRLETFRSVWFRRPVSPVFPGNLTPEMQRWAADEAQEVLDGLWRTHDALWVNHPECNRAASSKIEQLKTAVQLGMDVPDTLVSGEPAEVRAFAAAHRSAVICKPLRWGRVPTDGGEKLFFTSKIDADNLSVLEPLGPEPYCFQELVQKRHDIRVTVIGEQVFAVRIESQVDHEAAIDWRRKGESLAHVPQELPDRIQRQCIELVRHYGLQFAAIDFAERPDGRWTFFEVNPNGQWAWIEQLTGLPLRAALADLLLDPC
jgi:glutathione synthase/RimK-type ligase-like ATP-grasp enzyme